MLAALGAGSERAVPCVLLIALIRSAVAQAGGFEFAHLTFLNHSGRSSRSVSSRAAGMRTHFQTACRRMPSIFARAAQPPALLIASDLSMRHGIVILRLTQLRANT
jgi:hypothetical protein